ncbi:MAG TPA: prepilin-type N-terminal cleavage/methylation domain-containing protein [Gammaproteobacteria bacterium]
MKKENGFTLVELMVAMAIVAILASVALPSYREYVKKAGRTQALVTMNSFLAWQEKYFVANNTYTNDISLFDEALRLKSSGTGYVTQDDAYRVFSNYDLTRGLYIYLLVNSAGPMKDDEDCYRFYAYINGEKTGSHRTNGDNSDECLR